MKTLKEGTITPPTPWWHGLVLRCSTPAGCGAEVELEEGDKPRITLGKTDPKRRGKPVQSAHVVIDHCPTCQKVISHYVPNIHSI